VLAAKLELRLRDALQACKKVQMLKKLSQCIGVASLILVMQYGDLLGGGFDVRMHVPFALGGIVYAQMADIFLLGLALFVLIASLSRTRFYPALRLLLLVVVPLYLVERTRAEIPMPVSNRALVLSGIVWAAAVVLLAFRFDTAYRKLLRVADAAGIFFAVFAACSIGQLLYLTTWRPGPHEHQAAWAVTAQPPRQHPLIVWVVFDELSFRQVYEDRARDLSLPNFDALRRESTVFSNAQPIGDRTVKVIPSLLSGRTITDYRFSFKNRLTVHYADGHGFHDFGASQTIFADARQQGWRTAAVGWYNPYCTLYAGAIDDCYWMNHDKFDAPMAQGESFWSNTWLPLKVTGEQIVAPGRAGQFLCAYDVRQRYKTYAALRDHAAQLLRDDQSDFIFLHLPIPHSPNIWNRRREAYTQQCGSSYIDNLALADRELGEIMSRLKSSPRWPETTVVVEGDHSWRMYLWDGLPSWTDEDDAAAVAGFDPRPAMIVHEAGQTEPKVIASPWSILNIHTVLEEILHGQKVQL
jgi:hypothetical protein